VLICFWAGKVILPLSINHFLSFLKSYDYKVLSPEEKLKNSFDLKYDLFKDVEKIKKNKNYTSYNDIRKIEKRVRKQVDKQTGYSYFTSE
jgi:hypothetical protein